MERKRSGRIFFPRISLKEFAERKKKGIIRKSDSGVSVDIERSAKEQRD